ncbi:MAG: alpha-galactosidase [Clostridia bacterium]|nr:alpha-galactosidase [Clostridia bacterium]
MDFICTEKATDLFTVYGDFERPLGPATKNGNKITYKNSEIELNSVTTKHPSGVFERCDTIKNISKRDIEISTLLSKFTLNGGEYQVYTQTSKHIKEGIGGWQPLVSGVFGMSDEIRTNQDVNPFVSVFNEQNQRGIAFHIMCNSGFEYRVSRHGEFLDSKVVTVELGIKSQDFKCVLRPGEELCLPTILYYSFKSKLDMDAYKLHRYWNEKKPHSLPIVYNTWMSHFDYIDFDNLMSQLENAEALGCEYFTVDAGWFGKTQLWWDVVGDWQESSESAMKGRLLEFANQVRKKGLKFGLWFEIERANPKCENVAAHPEYYLCEGEHCFVDFANKEACDFIYGVLKANIDKYGVEFIKFDLNAPLCYDKNRCSFIKYFEGYNYFLSKIKSDYPSLHLECCASGGGRMSLSNAPYFDSFWMSDSHGIYTQLEIFKNALVRMPASMLERWATIRSVEGFTPTYPVGGTQEKILLSSTANWQRAEESSLDFIKKALVGGPIGISCDLTQVSSDTIKELSEFIDKYKGEREFWANSECHILCNTPTLTVLQFNDKDYKEIKIYSYTEHPVQEYATIYPFIEGEGSYTLIKSGCENRVISTEELNENGVCLLANYLHIADSITLKKL